MNHDQYSTRQDKIAHLIAGGILRTQLRIAGALQRQQRKLSTRQKKAVFFLGAALCAGYLIFLLGRALLHPLAVPLPDRIAVPATANPPPDSAGLPILLFPSKKSKK